MIDLLTRLEGVLADRRQELDHVHNEWFAANTRQSSRDIYNVGRLVGEVATLVWVIEVIKEDD